MPDSGVVTRLHAHVMEAANLPAGDPARRRGVRFWLQLAQE